METQTDPHHRPPGRAHRGRAQSARRGPQGRHRHSHVLLPFATEHLRRLPAVPGRRRGPRHRGQLLDAAGSRFEGADAHRRNPPDAADRVGADPGQSRADLSHLPQGRRPASCSTLRGGWESTACDSSRPTSRSRSTLRACRWFAIRTSAFSAATASALARRSKASARSTSLTAVRRPAWLPAFGKDLAEVECVNCGLCASVCPTGALTPRPETEAVWKDLENPKKTVVVQVAPAVRVALGEMFGMPAGTVEIGRIAAALKALGFAQVYDTSFAADLTVIEEAGEFHRRASSEGSGCRSSRPAAPPG